jgi:serine/threonine protein kinase
MTEAREHIQFGPYVVVRVSGAGGMGRIELALRADAKDPDVCVIKRLHGAVNDEEREARFRREAQIAARLEHENIARTLRTEKIDGELCIAQEFVEGVNLAKVMRQLGARPVPIVVAVHVVREVARGLAFAHGFGKLGIVHRDVTPENVMLSFAGDVKLIDFGIARSAVDGTLTNAGVVVGRRSYVPPEAWDGQKVDARADVFALGVVLWELLTGRRAEETHEAPLPDPAMVNDDVQPLLSQIVARAMAQTPGDRYHSADEFSAALAAFVPPGSDPRQELADLLGLCFNVALQKKLLAEEIAEVKQFVRDQHIVPASASLTELITPPPAAPTVIMAAQTISKRRGAHGPWMAAGVAAIVATSGIGLLRTHGRTTRARASAASLVVEPLPVASAPAALLPAAPASASASAVGPPTAPLLAPPAPTPAAEATSIAAVAAPTPAPEATSIAAVAPPAQAPDGPVGAGARVEPATKPSAGIAGRVSPAENDAPRVAGGAPESTDRTPHNSRADQLLLQANDLWERGNTSGAYALARQALAAGAGAPAHILLGTLLINMRNYAAAEPELATAVRLDPRNAEARRMLALLQKTTAEQQSR